MLMTALWKATPFHDSLRSPCARNLQPANRGALIMRALARVLPNARRLFVDQRQGEPPFLREERVTCQKSLHCKFCFRSLLIQRSLS